MLPLICNGCIRLACSEHNKISSAHLRSEQFYAHEFTCILKCRRKYVCLSRKMVLGSTGSGSVILCRESLKVIGSTGSGSVIICHESLKVIFLVYIRSLYRSSQRVKPPICFGGSVVICSPATREAPHRFPGRCIIFNLLTCMTHAQRFQQFMTYYDHIAFVRCMIVIFLVCVYNLCLGCMEIR